VADTHESRRYAGQAAVVLYEVSKYDRVEALVHSEDHGPADKRQEMFGSSGRSALTGEEQKATTCHPSSTAAVNFE
jgi:hypothetical protein